MLQESVALQRVQATTVLRQAVVAAGEACSRLDVLPGFQLIYLHDLLLVMGLGPRFHVFAY